MIRDRLPPLRTAMEDGAPLRDVACLREPVMGLDASLTGTGVAVIQRGRLKAWSTAPKGKTIRGPARLAWFYEEIDEAVRRYRPVAVVLEGYAFGARTNREVLGELGGVVRLALQHAGLPMLVVPPSTLKLFATGKGSGEKDMVSKEAFKRWGVDLSDNNAVDATVLALMGMAWLGAPPAATKAQLAAVEKAAPWGTPPAVTPAAPAPAKTVQQLHERA